MIRLEFGTLSPSQSVKLGPAPWFRIAGNFVRQGPHDSIAAKLRNHHWDVEGGCFTRISCLEPALIHFEDTHGDQSEAFGPFGELLIADGAIHADGRLFAKFVEESQHWHCFPTGNYWHALLIEPAG